MFTGFKKKAVAPKVREEVMYPVALVVVAVAHASLLCARAP
jgi:hypothetical protein